MRISITSIVSFILVLTGMMAARAEIKTELKEKVEALYEEAERALEAKDLEAFLSLYSDDYEAIGFGADKKGIRSIFRVRFGYEKLRFEYKILEITQSGEMIQVASDQKLEGKSGDRDWQVITQNTALDLLVQQGDSLKLFRSTEADKFRLKYIHGQTYKDEQTGFSFTAPENWKIFPTTAHQRIRGTVFVLAPDLSSEAMLGYVKAPGRSGKKAAESDEVATKILSTSESYELIKSGPIKVAGYEGFETESTFDIPIGGKERYRRRVYFNADGLLYPLCFDAMPIDQWGKVKDGFQSILDSIKIEE